MPRRSQRGFSVPQSTSRSSTRIQSFSQPLLAPFKRSSASFKHDIEVMSDASLPPLPKPYVKIRVLDFVTVPEGRLSAPRNALGPVDLLRRPPSYDLVSTPTSKPLAINQSLNIQKPRHVTYRHSAKKSHVGIQPTDGTPKPSPTTTISSPDHDSSQVFVLEDRAYAKRLLSIIGKRTKKDKMMTDLQLPTQPRAEYESSSSYDSNVIESIRHVSSRNASHTDSQFQCPYSDHSSDIISEEDAAAAQYTDFFNAFQVNTLTTLLSTSSLDESVLSGTFTSSVVPRTNGASAIQPSSNTAPLQTHTTITVDRPGTPERRRSLPTFMRKNVPSPAKYTFKPLQKPHPEQRADTIEATGAAPVGGISFSKQNKHLRRASVSCNPITENTQAPQSQNPIFGTAKKTVDAVAPGNSPSLASLPPLALPGASLFRRQRVSDESRSTRSGSSTRSSVRMLLPQIKRPSTESNKSSTTEYYEDDYTRFLERKSLSPMSLKLRHPYLNRMICHENWQQRTSQPAQRSQSSISLSPSDEQYDPELPIASE